MWMHFIEQAKHSGKSLLKLHNIKIMNANYIKNREPDIKRRFQRNRLYRILAVVVIVFALSGIVYPASYRFFGYNNFSLLAMEILPWIIGYLAIKSEGIDLNKVGGSARHLARALAIIIYTHLGFFLLVWVLRTTGVIYGEFIKPFSLWWLFDNWVLTGFGEELLFRGFLLVSIARWFNRKGFPFTALLVSSVIFALYHLPFSLWIGKSGIPLVMDIFLPFASSLVFGLAYVSSSNLWLAAFLHGVTDYPLSPLIKSNPFLGLLFMGTAILLGKYFLNPGNELPLEDSNKSRKVG